MRKVGRPEKPENEKKTFNIGFKVTPEEGELLQCLIEPGESVNQCARRLLYKVLYADIVQVKSLIGFLVKNKAIPESITFDYMIKNEFARPALRKDVAIKAQTKNFFCYPAGSQVQVTRDTDNVYHLIIYCFPGHPEGQSTYEKFDIRIQNIPIEIKIDNAFARS